MRAALILTRGFQAEVMRLSERGGAAEKSQKEVTIREASGGGNPSGGGAAFMRP